MNEQKSTGPSTIEKIRISPKRSIYIKLWPPSIHPQWGKTRASIEIQEARINEEKQVTYGKALRLPCDGSTALLANYLSSFTLEGRRQNSEFMSENFSSSKEENMTTNSVNSGLSIIEFSNLLLSQFKGQKLSKTRILKSLLTKGTEIDSNFLIETLEKLVDENKISTESAVHTSSGTTYTLWNFK